MIPRADIIAEARSWLGTRYQHQARAKGVGVDCIGVIGMTALACGVPGAQEWRADQTMHSYGPQPDPVFLASACGRFLDPVPVCEAEPADVLVIAFRRQPQHFAFIVDEGPRVILHAYLQRRKVVENGLPIAGSTVLRAYRLRGVV